MFQPSNLFDLSIHELKILKVFKHKKKCIESDRKVIT